MAVPKKDRDLRPCSMGWERGSVAWVVLEAERSWALSGPGRKPVWPKGKEMGTAEGPGFSSEARQC